MTSEWKGTDVKIIFLYGSVQNCILIIYIWHKIFFANIFIENELPLQLDTDIAGRCTQVGTDLFATHGLEHLLQLDTELLNVVEKDAGL